MEEGNQSILKSGCEMRRRRLGELGDKGFELQVGDSHGENPNFATSKNWQSLPFLSFLPSFFSLFLWLNGLGPVPGR